VSRRPRGAGNTRGGRGGGRGGGGVVPPPVLEAPELVPGLMAWFDSRSSSHFTLATGVSEWRSRGGALGTSLAWVQATPANQPAYLASVAAMGNRPAVQFDGVDDWLDANSPTAGTRLHNGLGASTFRIARLDSTGGATQRLLNSAANATGIGVLHQSSLTLFTLQVLNGTGTAVNSWNLSTLAHYARDVSRWQMWGYATGTMHSRVSGSSLTNADTGGPPSTSNSTAALRVGASNAATFPMKGWVCQEIHYDHVLTAGETTQLANWAAAEYGVAA